MARQPKHDPAFDIAFFEAIHTRVPSYVDVIELLGGLYTKTGRIADGLRMDRKLVRLGNPLTHTRSDQEHVFQEIGSLPGILTRLGAAADPAISQPTYYPQEARS